MKTERGTFRCVVRQYESGQPFLMFEPDYSGEIPSALRRNVLTMDLTQVMTLENATRLAGVLNDAMAAIGVTELD